MPYARKPKVLKRRPAVRRARRVAKRMPKVSAVVKSYVKSAISRKAETKFLAPLTVDNLPILPYNATTGLLTTINLTNALFSNQGAGQGDRIGDEIELKSMIFKGFINYNSGGSTQTPNPIYVKMVVGKLKQSILQPTTYANLFQAGNSVAPPQNSPQDILRNFNKDSWVIYHSRVFKLGNASPTVSGTGGSNYTNNDFSLCRMFRVSLAKHIHKVKYSDAGTQPQNVGLFVWFLMCNADGSAILTTPAPAPEIHYTVETAFKDS